MTMATLEQIFLMALMCIAILIVAIVGVVLTAFMVKLIIAFFKKRSE